MLSKFKFNWRQLKCFLGHKNTRDFAYAYLDIKFQDPTIKQKCAQILSVPKCLSWFSKSQS